jgi:hypothetical protein
MVSETLLIIYKYKYYEIFIIKIIQMAKARKETKRKSNRGNVVKNLKRIAENDRVLKMLVEKMKVEK